MDANKTYHSTLILKDGLKKSINSSWRLFLSIALRIPTVLRTILASLARAHERAHLQNVRDFPQTKLDSEINYPFLLNEHGDLRLFFQVFAKNILIKNIFEEEKSLIVEHDLFWKIVPNWVYFSQGHAPVVQRLDNAIHWINHYPVDSLVCFVNTYPLDSDLSGG